MRSTGALLMNGAMGTLRSAVGPSLDPLHSDLDVEVVAPLLISRYILGDLKIGSFFCLLFFQGAEQSVLAIGCDHRGAANFSPLLRRA